MERFINIPVENLKFKNEKAKRLYLKMLKAQKEQKKQLMKEEHIQDIHEIDPA